MMLDTCAAVHDTLFQTHCVMLLSLEDLVVFEEEHGQNIMEVTRIEPNTSRVTFTQKDAINHSAKTW